MRRAIVVVCVALITAVACGPDAKFTAITGATAREHYLKTLHGAGLDRSPLGAAWIRAGDNPLQCSQLATTPATIEAVFSRGDPNAVAFRFKLHRGERLIANMKVRSDEPVEVFGDLFDSDAGGHSRPLAGTQFGRPQVVFEPNEDDEFVMRVQPEMLKDAHVITSLRVVPALLFPVPDVGRSSIQSLYGASRDAGRREHQGIDIFAPKGTRVAAAANGFVTSTSPNRLGGNVVWVWDVMRGQTLYYAHLDSRAVDVGQWVSKGETIGYVGNTGNARTTAPHLHFGIYRRHLGAVDPLRYVAAAPSPARAQARRTGGTLDNQQPANARTNCE